VSSTAPRRQSPGSSSWWVPELIILAVCALALVLAFVLTPGTQQVDIGGWAIPELCGVKRLTGYPCPGCGLTRSWVYLAHGDWRTALSMNVLGPILFLTAAVQIPLRTWRIVQGARRRARRRHTPTDEAEDPCPA